MQEGMPQINPDAIKTAHERLWGKKHTQTEDKAPAFLPGFVVARWHQNGQTYSKQAVLTDEHPHENPNEAMPQGPKATLSA